MDDFYAARAGTIPTLPWQVFAPPLIYEVGLEQYFQHAVHLVTVERPELKTSPQNFNFIFKDYADEDQYRVIYLWLPYVLLFLSHVALGLFKRMAKLEKAAVNAFVVRSKAAYLILHGQEEYVGEGIGPEFSEQCGPCGSPISLTKRNLAMIHMCDQYRCTGCGRVSPYPLSWMF